MSVNNPVQKGDLYPNCDVTVWLRSCTQEIIKPITGTITGTIPKWLQGSLLRNGPGSIKAGNEYFSHMFDSSAFIHRFCIEDGNVTYQNRLVQSEVLKRNRAANRIVLSEFGTKAVPDPCRTIFDRYNYSFLNNLIGFFRVSSIFYQNPEEIPDNSMISVYPFGDEIYAFGELPVIHKIDKKSLETTERLYLRDYISIVHHTSHPHVMTDETVFNLALTVYPTGPYHTIVKFPPKSDKKSMFEQAEIVGGIPARWPLHPTYMHTFGLTDNYFVIVEQPLGVSAGGMFMAKIKDDPMISCLRWYQDEKTQISLISRETGKLAYKFHTEPFFYLHIVNQYEISDYVVVDVCTYRNPEMLDCMYIDAMKNMQQNPNYAELFRSRPQRFVLPLKPDKTKSNLIELSNTKCEAYFDSDGDIFIKPEKIVDLGCETPRINYEQYLGKPYRYFYAISCDVDADNPGTIIKVDTENKTTNAWCEPNCYPSEPIFVPKPNCEFEDDGLVLSAMIWGREDTNHVGLIILDAQSFTEVGRAEFRTPGPVPKCLHGWFLPK